MIEFIQNLLRREIEEEVREPFVTVPVPGLGTLGIVAPHPMFWAQLTVVVTIQSIINLLAAVSIYYLVVKHRGAVQSYLIGYGVICPALVVIPFYVSAFLGVHNKAMIMAQAGSMTVVFFRCLMGIHATLPPYVEKDVWSLIQFFVSPVQFVFDPEKGQVVKSSNEEFRKTLLKTLEIIIILTLVLSLMKSHDYELFGTREINTFLDLFYWKNIVNNFGMAYLTGTALAGGTMIVGILIESLSGNRVIELIDSPLTKSSGPSDFWGRRWNTLVHIVLKGGVYIPLRKNGFPVYVAAIATFTASGFLHEYILTAMAMQDAMLGKEASPPRYGMHVAFFAWNGIFIALERIFHKHSFIQECKRRLPDPLKTALIVMCVLPVGHWFTDEYKEIGFYDDFAVGFPKLIWTPFRQEAH